MDINQSGMPQSDIALNPATQDLTQADSSLEVQDAEANSQINLDTFLNSELFAGIDGRDSTIVILDSGIDLDHPAFGADANGDGVSDRIVYTYDFSDNNDGDVSNTDSHGSHVSSIAAAMAPGADIIHLKVFPDGEDEGAFGEDIEEALQWVVQHAEKFNIVSVNLSLGSGGYTESTPSEMVGDEFAALTEQNVAVVTSAGNDFRELGAGVGNYSADPNTISVGAVWKIGSGVDTNVDEITDFSQRHPLLTDIFAPGGFINGATSDGGMAKFSGTSQAAPHISGIVALAQQLAVQKLGRQLTVEEFRQLLKTTGATIHDGDDEFRDYKNPEIQPTGADYQRVDVFGLGEGILTASTGTFPTERADSLFGTEAADYLAGFAGDDTLSGELGDDILRSADGNDTLDGGLGIDQMDGGSGDDTYFVDHSSDSVVEHAEGGSDRVYTTVDYALPENIEILVTTGGQSLDVVGNSEDNLLQGNDADTALYGMEGDDQLLSGIGNDTLDGGIGDDQMMGGMGDDVYVIDSENDQAVEYLNEGSDRVIATLNYALNDDIEHLTLTGSLAVSGIGNSADNQIMGNKIANYLYSGDGRDQVRGEAGHDYLYGEAGNDWLAGNQGKDWLLGDLGNDALLGGTGNDRMIGGIGRDRLWGERGSDRLTGGADADQFVFSKLWREKDVITDFSKAENDQLLISKKGFGRELKRGMVSADQFQVGSVADDSHTRFIYNRTIGKLYFDIDGAGGQDQILFAKFAAGTMLDNKAIRVIA